MTDTDPLLSAAVERLQERADALEAQVNGLGETLATVVEHLTHALRRVSVLEQAAHLHVANQPDDDEPAGPSLTPAGPSEVSPPD